MKNQTDSLTPNMRQLLEKIRQANSIWLTTHRQADGDGLACEVAMLATLKKLGKTAKILNFEFPGSKYRFLYEQAAGRQIHVTLFDSDLDPAPPDLILLFDTNDLRLIEPLAGWASAQSVPIAIIDHHQGTSPPGTISWTDTHAASSGEVLMSLIDALGVEIDASIATPLYASLVFDTQNFRFIRASAASHKMAARLLPIVHEPERIHESLFSNLTPSKLGFLASALSLMRIEAEGTLAVVVLTRDLFSRYGADPSDSGDVIDMSLNVGSVKIALLLREESPGRWKVSMRSKRNFSVLAAAELIGGGGHQNASGSTVTESAASIEAKLKPILLAEIRRNMT